jgi:hypothetical protein
VKATLTVQCVYNKKHEDSINLDGNGQAEMPFCKICYGPMIAVKATINKKEKRR